MFSYPVITQVGTSSKWLPTQIAKVLQDPLMDNVYVVIQIPCRCKCLSTFLARIIWRMRMFVFPQTSWRRTILSAEVTNSIFIFFFQFPLFHLLFFGSVASEFMSLQMLVFIKSVITDFTPKCQLYTMLILLVIFESESVLRLKVAEFTFWVNFFL